MTAYRTASASIRQWRRPVAITLLIGTALLMALAAMSLAALDASQAVARDKALDGSLSLLGHALLATAACGALVLAFAFAMWQRESRERLLAQEDEARARGELEQLNATLAEQVRERTESLEAERGLAQRSAEHRLRLSRQLLVVQEHERRALARELHDDLGQQLAALKMNIETLLGELGPDHRSRLQDSVQIADTVIAQVRERAMSLRPALLDELGLGPALRWHAQKQGARFNSTVSVDVALDDTVPGDEWSSNVYRIVQEAISNALRHGHASDVVVQLFKDEGKVVLVVGDNGRGLPPHPTATPGMGLRNIAERVELLGGTMSLQSTPGGTELRVTWPPEALHGPHAGEHRPAPNAIVA